MKLKYDVILLCECALSHWYDKQETSIKCMVGAGELANVLYVRHGIYKSGDATMTKSKPKLYMRQGHLRETTVQWQGSRPPPPHNHPPAKGRDHDRRAAGSGAAHATGDSPAHEGLEVSRIFMG